MKIIDINKICGDINIMKMSNLYRYNNRTRLKNESIAEHSFYVALTALRLCEVLEIEDSLKLKILEMAIIHDVGETNSIDAPYTLKRDYKELSSILAYIEKEEMKKHFPDLIEVHNRFEECDNINNLAGVIVKLADVISVVQYSKNELLLGNKTYEMKDIFNEAVSRTSMIVELLRTEYSYDIEKIDLKL